MLNQQKTVKLITFLLLKTSLKSIVLRTYDKIQSETYANEENLSNFEQEELSNNNQLNAAELWPDPYDPGSSKRN